MQPEMKDLYDWFHSYVHAFYSTDPDIQKNIVLKEEHTIRVAEHSLSLAKYLGLSARDCRLAELTGLFHDIGRFRQYFVYRTFNDAQSENHALLGLKEIDGLAVLDSILGDDRDCLRFAVANHNALAIADTATDRQRLFARMIRDTDKLDIYRVLAPTLRPPNGQGCSSALIESLLTGGQCDYRKMRTEDDRKLIRLSWIYDINFAWTLQAITKQGYVEQLLENLPDTPEMRQAAARLTSYMQAKAQD